MRLLFLEFMVKNLGEIFSGIFLIYTCFIAIRIVKLCNVLSPPLKFLQDHFQKLKEACVLSYPLAVETKIEQIWIEYESRVQIHFSAINGYIYSIILWGFCGTIWGTIKAFSNMGENLFQKNMTAADALSSALQGGLNVALYTSLVAATIGAVMVTYMHSKYMYHKAKRLEGLINEEIYQTITVENALRKNPKPTDDEW